MKSKETRHIIYCKVSPFLVGLTCGLILIAATAFVTWRLTLTTLQITVNDTTSVIYADSFGSRDIYEQ